MGRRPHTLVQEYFDRGAKLADNSNRYQHTCKRCGEFFPKGRIDGLTTHLLRRCPNLSPVDRTWVFQQMQNTVEKSQSAKRSHAQVRQDLPHGADMEFQSELPPPFAQQQPSALETLAEVSGQHSCRQVPYSNFEVHVAPQQSSANTVAEAIAEQAFREQLHGHEEAADTAIARSELTDNRSLARTSLPVQHIAEHGLDVEDNLSGVSASSLVEAASAASQQLDHAPSGQIFMDRQFGNPQEQAFQSFNMPIDLGFRIGEPASAPDINWPQPQVVNQMPSFGSLAMPPQNDPMAGYGILSMDSKHKPRGRFSDVRRKEVSQIRKQGACLRCRMLKKPCSGDTPCKTCANVESARIWKGKCLRTRLSEELTLWSARVLQRRTEKRLAASTDSFEKTRCPIRIDMTMAGSLEFIALPGERVLLEGEDASERLGSLNVMESRSKGLLILNMDDRISDKIGAYATCSVDMSIEEQPLLIKDVLRRIQQHSANAPVEQVTPISKNLQQSQTAKEQKQLSKNVLELWALTELLDTGKFAELRFKAPGVPSAVVETMTSPQQIPATSRTHELMQAQVMAVIESRCSKLCRSVLNELEKRLLQRQQASRFTTLLSALLLLSCVERMAGYIKSLDADEQNVQRPTEATPSAAAVPMAEGTSESFAHEYEPASIESLPSILWTQGEHFAELLTSLLRMRALPPKSKINSDGILESIREFGMCVNPTTDLSMARKQEEESREAAADWLDALKLEAGSLMKIREADVSSANEAKGLKFVAKVLLPDMGR